jgi:hypothetical protein
VTLTHTKRSQLLASLVEYAIDLPEYPQTNPGGFAYIVEVRNGAKESLVQKVGSVSIIGFLRYLKDV